MARGGFSQEELDALNNNKYVIYAENNRIVYSNEFKFLFMKEFESGKSPKEIFLAAGFDTNALGYKRIERATARWKESYAAGTLRTYDDAHLREIHAANEEKRKKGHVQETVALQATKIKVLEAKIEARDKEIAKLRLRIHTMRMAKSQQKIFCVKKESTIINLLRAKVELLLTVGFIDRDKYDYSIRDKGIFYQLIHDTAVKYDITKGLTDLCNTLGLEQRGYYKYLQRKNIVADKCVSTTDT